MEDINGFAKRFAGKDFKRKPRTYMGKNQQLVDLGMGEEEMEDVAKVEGKIRKGLIIIDVNPGVSVLRRVLCVLKVEVN